MKNQILGDKNIIEICPVEDTLAVVGGKWKPLIIYHLQSETRRFSELQRLIKQSSARMLNLQLKELIADGLVKRKSYGEIPPRVEYSLTPKGLSILPVLKAMETWGFANQKKKKSIK